MGTTAGQASPSRFSPPTLNFGNLLRRKKFTLVHFSRSSKHIKLTYQQTLVFRIKSLAKLIVTKLQLSFIQICSHPFRGLSSFEKHDLQFGKPYWVSCNVLCLCNYGCTSPTINPPNIYMLGVSGPQVGSFQPFIGVQLCTHLPLLLTSRLFVSDPACIRDVPISCCQQL